MVLCCVETLGTCLNDSKVFIRLIHVVVCSWKTVMLTACIRLQIN